MNARRAALVLRDVDQLKFRLARLEGKKD